MKLIQTIRSVDPLIGFTLAGGAIFLLHALVAEPPIERERIEVTATTVDEIIRLRSEILSRPLTDEERAELIEQFVDEEILVREAVARGLHLADGKVRQRLRERMEFLLAESAPEPTAADLDRLRARHPNRYKTPQTVTFEHVFFAEDRGAAAALLEEVRDAARMPEAAGERFWLGRRMERYSASQLLVVLGAGFVDALGAMPTGEWTGPIESGRGWHLVRLESFHPRSRCRRRSCSVAYAPTGWKSSAWPCVRLGSPRYTRATK